VKKDYTNGPKVAEYLREHPEATSSEIALALNIANSTADLARKRIIADALTGCADESSGQRISADLSGLDGTITTRSDNIKTLDAALAAAKVDLQTWEVQRHVVNSWEVTMSAKASGSGKAQTFTNWQVKVWLRRKPTKVKSLENVIATLTPRAAKIPLRPAKGRKANTLLEVSLFDAHFGMLAWGRETGENYDLKIAESRYTHATRDLLAKSSGHKPSEILFVVGNDFLHIDNATAETPRSGNRLDMDGRLGKVLDVAIRSVVNSIQDCATVAPVRVMWIPGNHDPLLSYFLCLLLRERFQNSKHVSVNVDPAPRKYVRYGASLIGFTHGCDEAHRDLPTIMAGERPAEFGVVTTREFHVGHFHQRKALHFNGTDSFASVVVRVLPSLTGTDAWHFSKGYVAGAKAADAYLYDKAEGFVGHFTSRVT